MTIALSPRGIAAPTYHVEMAPTCRRLDAWSVFRLPFQPRAEALTFRDQLAAELAKMHEGRLLQARYTSSCMESVDLENVLTYNVGRLGAFECLATDGLTLERVFGDVPTCSAPLASPPLHHVQYVVPDDSRVVGLAWEREEPILSWERMAVPTTHCSHAWWAFRHSELTPHTAGVHTGRFGVRIRVPSGALSGRLVSAMKTLVDGVISGCSHHIGSPDPIVLAELAMDLGVPADAVLTELADTRAAVLGGRRLVGQQAGRPHWNPQDDDVVVIDLSYISDGDPWISGELMAVRPASSA